MATLYGENVPEELYEALRASARKRRSSIAAEVLSILKDAVPTESELKRRRKLMADLKRIHRRVAGELKLPLPDTESLIREDRNR
jgi:plasmid stability protein